MYHMVSAVKHSMCDDSGSSCYLFFQYNRVTTPTVAASVAVVVAAAAGDRGDNIVWQVSDSTFSTAELRPIHD
jgi:Tfp pilus assembly major pilin PilA